VRNTLVFILATVAAAQVPPPAPTPEVHGVVRETGTNIPLEGVEVTVSTRASEAGRATTDAQGAFRVGVNNLGTYFVRAGKEGYTDDGKSTIRGAASNQREVTLDKNNPVGAVRLSLAREGQLTGRVVDKDTGKPVPNFRVYPTGVSYFQGEIIRWGGLPGVTNNDGEFVITGLRAGNYVVNVGPQVQAKERFLDKFSEDDRKAVDHDYQDAYWPGGAGLDVASPVPLLPGGSTSVGTVEARKVTYYRIHLSIGGASCPPDVKFFIDGGRVGGEGLCGHDYLLRNYQSGSYTFRVMGGTSDEDRMRAVVPVEVADQNIDLDIAMTRGVDVDGRIVIADGAAKPPMDDIKIRLSATGNLQYPLERRPVSPDAEGRFQFVNRPVERVRISVSGLPGNFDVKEIRYNGSAVTDNIIALNGNSIAQNVEIVMDDKPAAVRGTVADGNRPTSRAHVVLLKWPVSREDIYLSANITEADDVGRFQFSALSPGDYRILAVPPESVDKLDVPRTLEALLRSAERVELSAGGNQIVSLKPTDPNR
jgi:Carboxypeptidase regulatory-like domain